MDIDEAGSEHAPYEDTDPAQGGRAAEKGHAFQDDVCAYHMVLMLAQGMGHPPAGLSAGSVTSVWPQARLPVNDIVVTTSEGGAAYIEATTRKLTLSTDPERSKLHKCLAQFARLYVRGRGLVGHSLVPSVPWDRALDPGRDRLVIATRPGAPQRAMQLLNAMASTARMEAHEAFIQRVRRRAEWQRVFDLLLNAIGTAQNTTQPGRPAATLEEDVWRLLQCLHVQQYDFAAGGQHAEEAMLLLKGQVVREPACAADAWRGIRTKAQEAAI